MTTRASRTLRDLVTPGRALLLPGAPNALTARILERAGAQAVYVSGAGIANTYLGVPDIGLVTLTELTSHVSAIRDVVEASLVVDADTGYGNAVNVQRTVCALERAGANGIQIEDQVMPKKCGHFDDREVISRSEMIGKIHAAVDARVDEDVLIIARTDALATEGVERACERACRYLEAGADVAFVEAPRTYEEIATISKLVPGPSLINIVEGGLTPALPIDKLNELGFAVVLYANTLMRVAMESMTNAAVRLLMDGDSQAMDKELISWRGRQNLVGKDEFDLIGARYRAAVHE